MLNEYVLGSNSKWVFVDGLYSIVYVNDTPENSSLSIKLLPNDNMSLPESVMNIKSGNSLFNTIASWVNDNIDDYSKKSFTSMDIGLDPTTPLSLFSKTESPLHTMPDVNFIEPIWLSAISEVIEAQLTCFERIMQGYNNNDLISTLSLVRKNLPQYSDLFCALLVTKEKVDPQLAFNNGSTQDDEFELKERLVQQFGYFCKNHPDLISENEEDFFIKAFLSSSDFYNSSFGGFLGSYCLSRKLYFPDGKQNDFFKSRALELMIKCPADSHPDAFILKITNELGICDPLKHQVTSYVNDNIHLFYQCS